MPTSDRNHNGNTGTGAKRIPGLSVREAAARLGVSERAVRARIKRQTLAAWTVEGKRGPVWCVSPDAIEAERNREGNVTGTGGEQAGTSTASWFTLRQERTALLARCEELTGQVEWLRGQVEEHQRHAGHLTSLLAAETTARQALEERVLTALPGQTDTDTVQAEQGTEQPRRWWWLRWAF